MNLKIMEKMVERAGKTFLTKDEWELIKKQHDYRCVYCGDQPEVLTKDHVVPLSRSGLHTADNVVPCCRSCNGEKGDRLLSEWGIVPYWWRES